MQNVAKEIVNKRVTVSRDGIGGKYPPDYPKPLKGLKKTTKRQMKEEVPFRGFRGKYLWGV
ncbi:hypothetical protein ALGA_0751 [Labilibaculum antarcticum]|uniref:Uncharacterized protein n=1 Tax=Labilibaculum antarcticum TaxID=1717717 RepID=A0A1Y1CFS8_9BACT|nr:hypothetical protein ALGA_0751 [Labilibaculum antarcticum]